MQGYGQDVAFAEYINLVAASYRKINDKWWKHVVTGEPLHRNRPEMMMLMVSEIAEALEGLRKGLMDDKLPAFKNEVVELADLFIRLMDYVGEYYPDEFGQAVIAKLDYNETRQDHTAAARIAPGGKKF